MKYLHHFLTITACLLLLNSCRLFYPNRMFKSGRDYTVVASSDTLRHAYLIGKGDKLKLRVLANKGIDLLSFPLPKDYPEVASEDVDFEYTVDERGYVRLPVIDSIHVAGLAVRELENQLEALYGKYYKDPLVAVSVTNKRVIVFLGSDRAQVLELQNDNINLVEVIAQAGGMPVTAKAFKIRIIRGNLKDPVVRMVDLSSFASITSSNLEVQPNDIIYVEPVVSVLGGITKDILPWVSLLTTVLFLVTLVSSKTI